MPTEDGASTSHGRRKLTSKEVDRGIAKLHRRISEVRELDPDKVEYDGIKLAFVRSNWRETIREVFGEDSPEFAQYGRLTIGESWIGAFKKEKFAMEIAEAVKKLERLEARLEESREDLSENNSLIVNPAPIAGTRRVFVVHGREESTKEMVAGFLELLHLQPIILHEQASQGQTIIEKFERHAEVAFAVVLLTPDDNGYPATHLELTRGRARQNVIFELGYFIGRIGRARVCALYKANVELPSDFDGVAYVPIDDPKGWRLPLAREIQAAGIELDLKLLASVDQLH